MRTRNLLFLVACLIFSLNVKAQDDYLKVTDLSQIQNGSSVIFAARHDSLSPTAYYAMSNDAHGKPQGVLFTAMSSEEGFALPTEIATTDSSYCWTVGMSDDVFTFINPKGDMIGYGSSGTDFVKNGVNSTWTITAAVSGGGTSVPNHNAFIITNSGVANRSIAFRKYSNDAVYEKFAPYSNSTTNLGGDIYFFYIDIFVKSSEITPIVSLPKFTPSSGDYTTTQYVEISCDTEGAIIYYTIDGKNPTEESEVYSQPIEIAETTTIKAFAKKEGMKNSGVATATFKIVETVKVSFYENGKQTQTKEVSKGDVIGELPQAMAPEGFSFSGWTDAEITEYDKMPEMVNASTKVDEDVSFYAVYSVANENSVEADVSGLSKSDKVIMTISKDDRYYAMSQIKGSNGQPTAKELVVSNGTIVSAISGDMKWNIAYNKGDMIIYPSGDEESWLYCTSGSNNNAVRIGTNEDNNVFEMKSAEIGDVVYSNYLYNKSTERFVGAYYDNDTAIDWRAYKLTASGAFPANIKGQTYHFFKTEGTSIYCTSVDIPQAQTIAENTIWENVSVQNKIVVEKGATLTVKGAITCDNADNLVIKEGGQLLHNNKGLMATVEKEIQGYVSTNEGWYTISSPLVQNVELTNVKDLMPVGGDYDLYRYDEPRSCWENVKDVTNDFTAFEAGRGYLYASKQDATISFIGEINSESISYNLTKTEGINLSGFHLIGNPYVHNIYKGAAIDDENLVDGHYTLSNSGAWEVNVSNENPIMPCQSVLVKLIASGEVVLNKTNQKPLSRSSDEKILMVGVSNEDYEDRAYIVLDGDYGLEKIKHQNKDIPMIYFTIDDENYAITTLDSETKEVPLSFVANTMGEYTISIKTDNKVFEDVYLVDKTTGIATDILTEDYTFIATANDDPNRFTIKLSEVNSVDEYCSASDMFAYVNNGEVIIEDISGEAVVSIYDIMGRRVADVESVKNTSCIIEVGDVKPGLNIIRVSDKKGIRTQKIIL